MVMFALCCLLLLMMICVPTYARDSDLGQSLGCAEALHPKRDLFQEDPRMAALIFYTTFTPVSGEDRFTQLPLLHALGKLCRDC